MQHAVAHRSAAPHVLARPPTLFSSKADAVPKNCSEFPREGERRPILTLKPRGLFHATAVNKHVRLRELSSFYRRASYSCGLVREASALYLLQQHSPPCRYCSAVPPAPSPRTHR